MALLAVLHELAPEMDLELTVAHLNHCIRGREADEDERFVCDAAKRLGLDIVTGRRDVGRLARRNGQSLEMAGREARYAFFASVARKRGCAAAATGHTADDHAETFLLKLARGTGFGGLRGIPRSTTLKGLRIIRPLRDANRENIVRFLEKRGSAWREDASNQQVSFLRNRVRGQIMPAMQSMLNPQLRRALLRLGDIVEAENEWLDSLALKILSECRVPKGRERAAGDSGGASVCGPSGMRRLPFGDILCEALAGRPLGARRRALRLWLVSSGLPHESLDFETIGRLDRLLVSGRTASSVTPAGGWVVRREYGRLIVRRAGDESPVAYSAPVLIPGETLLAEEGFRINASVEPGITRARPAGIGAFPDCASLNVEAWRRRKMIVRSWRRGDRMRPMGISGSKKLQDIFVDAKIAADVRRRAPIFECGGEIVWLPGYRIARGWQVPESGVRALQLRIERI